MIEVIEKRFSAMISNPTIASSFVFFKKNIILTSLFADAAPESKKKMMTNSYIRFLNFLGVGSSPAMMPWLNGGNFLEGSQAFEWLHNNVTNKEIEQLESLTLTSSSDEEKKVKFFVLPVGDLSYQSKVSGHQGCASKYFSVYWADMMKENGGEKREGMKRRDLEWMKEQVKKVRKKEEELEKNEILSIEQKKTQLQEYVKSECHNQSKIPWLLICERFVTFTIKLCYLVKVLTSCL